MPWTVDDVDRFKSGLTDAQKRQWVAIANRALADCEKANGTNCDAKAIRQANGAVKASEQYVRPLLFADVQEWVSFLPRPGQYEHPTYGTIDLSPQRIANLVSNFHNNVYGQSLPINAEHDMAASGAVGWIEDMRIGSDGSIEVKPKWNDRGQALLDGDRFRYVSAEWFDTWQHPTDNQWHEDIASGMAICTHPYFKEDVLRPLAASEAEAMDMQDDLKKFKSNQIRWTAGEDIELSEDDPKDEPKPDEDPVPEPEPTPEPEESMADEPENDDEETPQSDPVAVTLNEATVREFNEMKRQLKLANTEKATLLAEKNALLSQRRQREFTAEVRGKSDDNDTPWIGDIEDHVKMCISLAEHYGDASFELEQYKRTNRATAAQIKQSNLFKEIGTSKSGEGLSADEQIQAYAKQLRQADPKLTPEGAYAKALKENPRLYEESING